MSLTEKINDEINSEILTSNKVELNLNSYQIDSKILEAFKTINNKESNKNINNSCRSNINGRNANNVNNNSLSLMNTIDLIILSEPEMLRTFFAKVKVIIEDESLVFEENSTELKNEIIDNIKNLYSIIWNKYSLNKCKSEELGFIEEKKIQVEICSNEQTLSFISPFPCYSKIDKLEKEIQSLKKCIIENNNKSIIKKEINNILLNNNSKKGKNENKIKYLNEKKIHKKIY